MKKERLGKFLRCVPGKAENNRAENNAYTAKDRRAAGVRPEEEHILVCLSGAPSNAKIIRTAARMARVFHGTFTALFVETPDFSRRNEQDQKRLQENIRLAEHLGAKIEKVYGDDISYQIAEFARLFGVSKVVIGRSMAARRHMISKPTLTDKLIVYAPDLEIHIIPDGVSGTIAKPEKHGRIEFSVKDLIKSLAVLGAATALSVLFYKMGFTDANIITVYILGVLITSVITEHMIYSFVDSLASVIIFNFMFTDPRYTLLAYDKGYPVTFLVMFLAAFLTGTLAARLKEHARQSVRYAYRTKILFDTDQLLRQAQSREEIATATAEQLFKLMERDVVIYLAEEESLSRPYFCAVQSGRAQNLFEEEKKIALWVLKNNRHAGASTDQMQDARCHYLAIRVGEEVYGVAGIEARENPLGAFENSTLFSILGECALALENEKNAREKEEAAVLAQNEQLRANLLRTISHDLRTPLTSISGNASNLLNSSGDFDEETKRQLYSDIYEDSIWLINLVENLLFVSRMEGEGMKLNTSAELMEEVIEEALHHVSRKCAEHEISVSSSEEFIFAKIDAKLIVQVIINLVENAVKYTPRGSKITISAEKRGTQVIVSVSDNGPGIPDEIKPRVFEMFYCGTNQIKDGRRSLGLGLALCKSIITAHGGELTVTDNHPCGAVFTFTLPSWEVKLHE